MKIEAITQAPFGTIISLNKPVSGVLDSLLTTDGNTFYRIKGISSDIWTEILIDKTDALTIGQSACIISESSKQRNR